MKPRTLFLVCLIVFLSTSFLIYVLPVHASTTLTLRPNATGTYQQFSQFGGLFGDTNVEATSNKNTGVAGCKFTSPRAVTLIKITAYVHLNVTGYMKAAVYNCSTGGNRNPVTNLVNSSPVAVGTSFAWVDFPVSVALYASEEYSFQFIGDSAWYNVYGTGTTNQAIYKTATYPNFPSPYGTPTGYVAWNISIYATYLTHDQVTSDQLDTTGVQITTDTSSKETENIAGIAQTGTINSVTAYMRANGTATTNQAVIVWRTYSTDYESSAINMSTSFAAYSETRTTNPNTAAAWTWAEVEALEVGARASTLPSGTIQFSEFCITVTYTSDAIAPTYSSISANTTVAGALCSFNCLVNDDTNVSTYIFSTNNTGTWTNDSATTFSNFFNITAAWANVTKTLNDTVGDVVSYVWYANDTSNNWSSSDQYSFTLTAPYRPNLQMTPGSITCRKYLETFSIQINVTNAIDTQTFNFTVYYDPQVLNYSSVSWGELGTGTMTKIDTTNGILEGNVAGSPVSGNHWLLNITFQADKVTIWKMGLANELEGKIWFHQAELGFEDGSALRYVEGGINQTDVNQVVYTFLPIRGDVNNDGTVDLFDLRAVAFYYDKTQADPVWPEASKYDLNSDNTIDVFDLVIVASNFWFTYP